MTDNNNNIRIQYYYTPSRTEKEERTCCRCLLYGVINGPRIATILAYSNSSSSRSNRKRLCAEPYYNTQRTYVVIAAAVVVGVVNNEINIDLAFLLIITTDSIPRVSRNKARMREKAGTQENRMMDQSITCTPTYYVCLTWVQTKLF